MCHLCVCAICVCVCVSGVADGMWLEIYVLQSFFFTFLHFFHYPFFFSFFFTFLYFSSCFFIFLHFSSFFCIFLHFSLLFLTFLHFSSFFFTFLQFSFFFSGFSYFSSLFFIFFNFSILWRKMKKSGYKTKISFHVPSVCVCIRHLRWHVDRHLCFAVTFLHLSPLFSTFLRFSHFLHFSSRGNTTGRGSTAGNEKCHVYEFMKLKLETCHCVTYSNFNHVVSCNKLCSESASTLSLVQNLCFAIFCNIFSAKKTWKQIVQISLQ